MKMVLKAWPRVTNSNGQIVAVAVGQHHISEQKLYFLPMGEEGWDRLRRISRRQYTVTRNSQYLASHFANECLIFHQQDSWDRMLGHPD